MAMRLDRFSWAGFRQSSKRLGKLAGLLQIFGKHG